MNVLEDIVQSAIERRSKYVAKVEARNKSKDEYDKKMTSLANECREILTDLKYKNQQEFLAMAIETLQDALVETILSVSVFNVFYIWRKIFTISAEIRAYKKIMTRPEKVLKEIEDYKKTVGKEYDNGKN